MFPLAALAGGELRIVVINKHGAEAAGVQLSVVGGAGAYGDGNVTRLVASGPRPLQARYGISLAGRSYAMQGDTLTGAPAYEMLPSIPAPGGGAPTYKLYMPPGSAALVVLPPARRR